MEILNAGRGVAPGGGVDDHAGFGLLHSGHHRIRVHKVADGIIDIQAFEAPAVRCGTDKGCYGFSFLHQHEHVQRAQLTGYSKYQDPFGLGGGDREKSQRNSR